MGKVFVSTIARLKRRMRDTHGGQSEVLSKRDDMHLFSDTRDGLAMGKSGWSNCFVEMMYIRFM